MPHDGGNRVQNKNLIALYEAIQDCEKNCYHKSLFPGFIPTRLVDLGAETCLHDDMRLAKRATIINSITWHASSPSRVKYAALSYCWGSRTEDIRYQAHTSTRPNTISNHLENIKFWSLSPVIRDAIVTARQLSIRFLWVDSLCIIQDDVSDFTDEASLIGLVYSNAYLTIVPLSSSGCSEGFIKKYNARLDKGISGTMQFLSDWRSSAWSTRGWTFQEEKLSTRLVYFAEGRAHFCCHAQIKTVQHGIYIKGKPIEGSILDMDAQGILKFWRDDLMPQFSARTFAFAADRLPAIGTIAKYISDSLGYQYVAGLFKEALYYELMWFEERPSSDLGELLRQLASSPNNGVPSWAWARPSSRHTSFYFADEVGWGHIQPSAEFQVSMKSAGANPYANVLSGELVIRGKAMRLNAHGGDLRQGKKPDHYDVIRVKMEEVVGNCMFDWRLDGILNTSSPFQFVQVAESEQERTYRPTFYGIIVLPASQLGKYHRVGIFEFHESTSYGKELLRSTPRRFTII